MRKKNKLKSNKKIYVVVIFCIFFLVLGYCIFLFTKVEDTKIAIFKTSIGDFKVELYTDLMPITTNNFIKLSNEKFFHNQRFHRVIENFIIQAGDPNSKDINLRNLWGRGGPGYNIEDEFVKNEILTNSKYTISMANTGAPNSSGSQFFINLIDNYVLDFNKEPLTSKHPVFGKVIEGFETIDKIAISQNGEVIIYEVLIE